MVQRVFPGEADSSGQLHAFVYRGGGSRRNEGVGNRRQCGHALVIGRDRARGLHHRSPSFDLKHQELNQTVLHRLKARDWRTKSDAVLEICREALQCHRNGTYGVRADEQLPYCKQLIGPFGGIR